VIIDAAPNDVTGVLDVEELGNGGVEEAADFLVANVVVEPFVATMSVVVVEPKPYPRFAPA
jgi:hypothetical protein